MKKPIIAFTIADETNLPYAKLFINSLRKFHSEEELPLKLYGPEEIKDLARDPNFFYRATPQIAKDLIKEYDTVLKFDCDQLVLGDLKHILSLKDYDAGVVYNLNRVDPPMYGEVGLATIAPSEYFNNGFVAIKSEAFVKHWWKLCNVGHFQRMPYREQGFLNILGHYGDYKVRCFDDYDPVYGYSAWHGLRAKGEGMKMKVHDGKVILPKSEDGYPDRDKEIKLYHWGGGNTPNKLNYRTVFSDEVVEFIDGLVKEDGKKEA